MGANVIENYERGLTYSAQDVAWALTEQTRIFRAMHALFEEVDILICPTVAVPPFPLEQRFVSEINGVALESYIDWMALCWGLTMPGNPVTALPCGRDHTNAPFGLQICGRFRDDGFVLGVAQALERLFADNPDLDRPRPDIAALTAAG